jgi:hypothetical protein
MLRAFWLNIATLFMQTHECMLLRRKRVASHEEVVADLYTYHEQMTQKSAELDIRIERCHQRALLYIQTANAEKTDFAKEREMGKAKMQLKDRRRLQNQQDRTNRFMHLLRQQIDSIASSQMDNIMVEAMQQYNMTAKRMGLPDKSKEIDSLGTEIQERFEEVSELQGLLSEAANPCSMAGDEDEQELMLELEALLMPEPTVAPAEPKPALLAPEQAYNMPEAEEERRAPDESMLL